MQTFTYRAKNLKGEELRGSFSANNREQVRSMLDEKGYFLIDARAASKQYAIGTMFDKVKIKDISVFCRQFSVILSSGITIIEAVKILSEQSENKKMQRILGNMLEEIQKGKLLSDAFELHTDTFPEFMINMIKVGEASGSLTTIMDQLADYYEKDNRIRNKVKTAMTYPAILAVLTIGVVLILLVKVLPMFTQVLGQFGGELPTITKVMIGASNFLVDNFLVIMLFLVATIAGLAYYFKTYSGAYWLDGLKLKIPIIRNTNVKVMTSRFARCMGILLKSGIPVINAVEIMGNMIGNHVVAKKFIEATDHIRGGKGMAGPLQEMGVFPPLLIHMVAVGERTGELDDMLTRTAGFFDEEVDESIQKLTTMIEPIMLIIMAVVVGSIVVAVLMPMLSIMNAVQ